jgi:hypothetical protein
MMRAITIGRGRSWQRTFATALALSAGAACAPRAPEPPGPVDVSPLPPRVEPSAPRDAPLPLVSGRFAYAPGTYRYEVVTESEIRQPSDSAMLGSDTVDARVRTVALYTLQLDRLNGDSIGVALTLDSLAVERDSLVPAPDSTVASEAGSPGMPSFAAVMDARGGVHPAAPGRNDPCSQGEALLGVARDLLVAVPPVLTVGERWSDTTTAMICRGGVPVTSGVVRDFEVIGTRRDADGTPLMRVSRATRFSLAGTQTTAHRQVIALTGRGESRAMLELDLRAGTVRSATREGTSEVVVTYGRRSTPFTQRVVQRVRMVKAELGTP